MKLDYTRRLRNQATAWAIAGIGATVAAASCLADRNIEQQNKQAYSSLSIDSIARLDPERGLLARRMVQNSRPEFTHYDDTTRATLSPTDPRLAGERKQLYSDNPTGSVVSADRNIGVVLRRDHLDSAYMNPRDSSVFAYLTDKDGKSYVVQLHKKK